MAQIEFFVFNINCNVCNANKMNFYIIISFIQYFILKERNFTFNYKSSIVVR